MTDSAPETPATTRRISAWQCITCGHLTKRSLPPTTCSRCGIPYTIDNHVAYSGQPAPRHPPQPDTGSETPGDGHYLLLVASAGIAVAGAVVGILIVVAIVIAAWQNPS